MEVEQPELEETFLTDSEEEHLVLEISKERHNKKKATQEFFVTWSDGTKSWEPRENLVDDDGTENFELLRFNVRQSMIKEKKVEQAEETYVSLTFTSF